MAWNPSKEVAVARDAAKALGDAPQCIVIWVTPDGERLGVASYGRTRELCAATKVMADAAYDAVMESLK